ncbi:MAG: hypothetical protein ABJF11_13380 [Reichenbachiella sp.]|uniref:hypothetical protein n=1 Tax=Reichenbachiella sp. TaxID=2184521 RepID=UPI00326777F0
MKNHLLISGLFTVAALISSCSDDDDSGFGDIPEALEGTWNSVELTISGCEDDSDNGTCSVGCLSFIFTEEGAFSGSLNGQTILGTVTANENTLRLCDPTGECTDVTYDIGELVTTVSWTDSEDGCTYTGTIVQPEFPSELVGTWVSESATATGCDDDSDNGTCTQDCLTYTFSSTGAFNGTFADEPERTGFGYANGSTLNLCWSGDFGCQAVTYSIDGNTGDVSWDDNEDGCSYTASITKQ